MCQADERTISALRIRRRCGVGLLLLSGMLLLAAPTEAEAQEQKAPAAPVATPANDGVNLNITPKRLTFARGDRTATVYIFNRGTAPATFDIAMVDRVMLPSGEIRPVSEAAGDPAAAGPLARLQSAKGMLVTAPRRATLAPGAGQTIRVRVSPPAEGGASEYRSHLTVATVPPPDAGLTANEAASQGTPQLSFRVKSVFGLSIPIIVRPGAADAKGEIQNPQFSEVSLSPDGIAPPRQTTVLSLDLVRTGQSSLFGNVEVRGQGKQSLGAARGFGVYTEIDRRRIQIPLQRRPAHGEQVEIVFLDDDTAPGRAIAKASVRAP